MSRVYFHSPSKTVELRGAERAHMGQLVNNLGLSHLHTSKELLQPFIPPTSWASRGEWNEQHIDLWLRAGDDAELHLPSGKISVWEMALNTCIAIGNDPVRLAARIHAQCEIHAYVEADNRPWLADIIEEGRKLKIFRQDLGWEAVEHFLRRGPGEPVVLSYSVCDQFPNPGTCTLKLVDEEREKWYDLPHDVKWDYGMKALRGGTMYGRKFDGLEMKPDNWKSYRFGEPEMTVFEVNAEILTARDKREGRKP